MEKTQLDSWIERLKAEPDGKKRQGIVSEMCKTHGLKIGDAWKLLKEAGFGGKADGGDSNGVGSGNSDNNSGGSGNGNSGDGGGNGDSNGGGNGNNGGGEIPGSENPQKSAEKKIRVTLRHKTEYPRYRRAGLALGQTSAEYEVSGAQLATLKKDPWVVIEKEVGDA